MLRIIASHIGATVELMLTSTLLAIVIGAWVGILGAIKRYSISDSLATIGDGSFLNQIHQLIGPCIVLALVSTAVWSRDMRSSMLDVINQDDIRTARA